MSTLGNVFMVSRRRYWTVPNSDVQLENIKDDIEQFVHVDDHGIESNKDSKYNYSGYNSISHRYISDIESSDITDNDNSRAVSLTAEQPYRTISPSLSILSTAHIVNKSTTAQSASILMNDRKDAQTFNSITTPPILMHDEPEDNDKSHEDDSKTKTSKRSDSNNLKNVSNSGCSSENNKNNAKVTFRLPDDDKAEEKLVSYAKPGKREKQVKFSLMAENLEEVNDLHYINSSSSYGGNDKNYTTNMSNRKTNEDSSNNNKTKLPMVPSLITQQSVTKSYPSRFTSKSEISLTAQNTPSELPLISLVSTYDDNNDNNKNYSNGTNRKKDDVGNDYQNSTVNNFTTMNYNEYQQHSSKTGIGNTNNANTLASSNSNHASNECKYNINHESSSTHENSDTKNNNNRRSQNRCTLECTESDHHNNSWRYVSNNNNNNNTNCGKHKQLIPQTVKDSWGASFGTSVTSIVSSNYISSMNTSATSNIQNYKTPSQTRLSERQMAPTKSKDNEKMTQISSSSMPSLPLISHPLSRVNDKQEKPILRLGAIHLANTKNNCSPHTSSYNLTKHL